MSGKAETTKLCLRKNERGILFLGVGRHFFLFSFMRDVDTLIDDTNKAADSTSLELFSFVLFPIPEAHEDTGRGLLPVISGFVSISGMACTLGRERKSGDCKKRRDGGKRVW